MLCRVLSSISGLYPLDAGSTIQAVTKKICSDIVRDPSGAKSLPVESYSSDFRFFFSTEPKYVKKAIKIKMLLKVPLILF